GAQNPHTNVSPFEDQRGNTHLCAARPPHRERHAPAQSSQPPKRIPRTPQFLAFPIIVLLGNRGASRLQGAVTRRSAPIERSRTEDATRQRADKLHATRDRLPLLLLLLRGMMARVRRAHVAFASFSSRQRMVGGGRDAVASPVLWSYFPLRTPTRNHAPPTRP
ncbi:uncharacterized protein Tco025E_09853, partial [Trypanosoma conorhini]